MNTFIVAYWYITLRYYICISHLDPIYFHFAPKFPVPHQPQILPSSPPSPYPVFYHLFYFPL